MASPDPSEIVELANSLLDKLPGGRQVMGMSDLDAAFYVLLYEGLFAEPLPDAVSPPSSREDEIHNVQMVIDTLSLDKLHTSMSHISGQGVVNRDITAVHDLLQVFEWLYDYMLEKISEASSTTPSLVAEDDFDDPDMVTPELIDDVLRRELNKSRADSEASASRHGNSTAELIALGQVGSAPDSSVPAADRTSELIALGDSRYGLTPPHRGPRDDTPELPPPRQPVSLTEAPTSSVPQPSSTSASHRVSSKPPKPTQRQQKTGSADNSREESVVLPEKPAGDSSQFEYIGSRTRQRVSERPPLSSSLHMEKDYTVTHHLYHHYNGTVPPPAAPSMPFDGTRSLPIRLADSHNIDTQTTPGVTAGTQEKRDQAVAPRPAAPPPKSPVLGYDRLHSLVADTVSMSRAALDSSPKPRRKNTSPPRQHPSPRRSNQKPSPKRRSPPRHQPQPQGILSPTKQGIEKNRRKVSFLTNRSSSDEVPSTDTSADLSSFIRRQGVLERIQQDIDESKSRHEARRGGGDRLARTTTTTAAASRQSNVSTAAAASSRNHRMLSSATEDESYFSDGCVDYGADSENEGDFMQELRAYKEKLDKRAKQVRFDDILDEQAPGRMGPIRRQLLKEDRKARQETEFLRDRYNDEVVDYEEALKEELQKLYDAARTKDMEYKKKVLRQPKTNKYKPQQKYNVGRAGTAKSSVLYPGHTSRSRHRSRSRKRSASASPSIRPRVEAVDELLPFLLEEFPYLHLAPETVHAMWKKSARQIQLLAQSEHDMKAKKSKALQQVEEAEQKHKVLVGMMKKEVTHASKMREVEERRRQQQAVKASIRDKRQASARSRRYYEEYHLRMRAKKLKKRTKEEQIFKQLFNEGLDIQKQRIRELRKYAKEQREIKAQKNRDQVESIENYYRDQFKMLSETLETEKKDRNIRDKAQTKVVQQLQRDLRRQLEQEVQDIQEQILRDEDDVYFRELDAQRLRTKLKLSRFQAAV